MSAGAGVPVIRCAVCAQPFDGDDDVVACAVGPEHRGCHEEDER